MTDEVALLREMLEIYSPSTQEGQLAAYLRDRMAELGFRAHVDAAGNAVGEIGDGSREVVLVGHIDTVDGFIPLRQEGDLLYGRGAVDAKGPMATFIMAASRAKPRDLRIVVVGAVEEEAASSRGARYIAPRHKPQFAVIGEPSGWAGITLGYKGRLWLNYALERPVRHSAGPGRAAAEEAVDFWHALSAMAADFNRGRKPFDCLDLSLRRINSSTDGFTERVEQLISMRVPVDFDVEAFKGSAGLLANGARCAFSNEDPAFRADKGNALVRQFLGAIRDQGGEPKFKLKTGTSDMNVVGPEWGCPIVAYGPGDSTLDHTPGEHIVVDDYKRAIAVLTAVLNSL
ncbi:MAG: [LysW]-lysine hydrolase [Chloroflexota bacterium]